MRPLHRPTDLMRHAYQALCLVALLIAGQQGAVVHELGHLVAAHGIDLQAAPGDSTEGTCALCPMFAQAATAAFSHSIHVPPLERAALERSAEPRLKDAGAAVPTPRSRGPPVLR